MKTLMCVGVAVVLMCIFSESHSLDLSFDPESLIEEFSVDDNGNDDFQVQGDGCKCDKTSCSCCKKINIKKGFIHIKKDICVKMVYQQSTVGVDLQLTLDGKVIAHYMVKTNNPPPVCGDVDLPGIGKERGCIKLEKFHVDNKGVSGCVGVTVDGKIKVNVEIGCFKIPQAITRIRNRFLFEREIEYSK